MPNPNPNPNQVRRETLCLSYARQPVDLLTVSDFSGDPAAL